MALRRTTGELLLWSGRFPAGTDLADDVRDLPNGLPRGSQLMGRLPDGGTLDRLLALAGLALLLSGSTLLIIQRRRCAR